LSISASGARATSGTRVVATVRISDQASRLAAQPTQRPRQLARLRLRSRLLDAAVLLAAIAGALTCCAALTLFLRALRSGGGGAVLFALFGGALVCAVAALAAFAAEMGLAGRTVREMVNAEDPTAPSPQV
jgi:hypothetical protein